MTETVTSNLEGVNNEAKTTTHHQKEARTAPPPKGGKGKYGSWRVPKHVGALRKGGSNLFCLCEMVHLRARS